jgi:hypothetical protein
MEMRLMPNTVSPQEIERMIEAEYAAGEYGYGWRFLMGPKRVLENADVAFIGLNPGGDHQPENHGLFSTESGSAYVIESWKGRPLGEENLQFQVQSLFGLIDVCPKDVLAGNFVPFRSPNWKSLKEKKRALAFAKKLWRLVLKKAQPALIVTMGKEVEKGIKEITEAHLQSCKSVMWGKVTARIYRSETSIIVHLPHLSTFRLLSRPVSKHVLVDIFEETSGTIDQIRNST